MATSQDVDYSVRDHTAWLTMNRPGVLNALSKGVFRGLELALASASSDPAVHSIVIRGEGRAFSAGLDVKEVSGFATQKEARDSGCQDRGRKAPRFTHIQRELQMNTWKPDHRPHPECGIQGTASYDYKP